MGFLRGWVNLLLKMQKQVSPHPILIQYLQIDFMLIFVLEVYCFVDLQLLVYQGH